MQKGFFLTLIAVCSAKTQSITITAKTCSPPEGETGSDNYAVLKRVCYSGSRYYFQRRWYSPKFYPLTKGTLYKTSQATSTCGAELSIMFHGKEVCVSFTYEEYRRLIRTTKLSLSRREQKCFSRSTTILERRYFPAVLYNPDSKFNSYLNLIITPNHHDIQPTAEPCYPTTGETGSLDVAILKRTWCHSSTKKICYTVSYLLFKNVSFMTSQANRTYGPDVSVIFYGKEVCIAYMYERFSYRISYKKSVLDTSYCKKTCFTAGYKSNQQEKVGWFDDLFPPTFVWESDYELIVTFGNTGLAKCMKFNFITVLLSILTSVLVSFQ